MSGDSQEGDVNAIVPLGLWAITEDELSSSELDLDAAPGDIFARRTITTPMVEEP